MYEGKHIHFSEVDNKPLCSYSPKLCKQRRLNGYAFCIRHVLEDKTAPFKQCEYVAKYNSQRCTNPIPKSEDRRWVAVACLRCGKWPGRRHELPFTTVPGFRIREELAWVNWIPGCFFEGFVVRPVNFILFSVGIRYTKEAVTYSQGTYSQVFRRVYCFAQTHYKLWIKPATQYLQI